MIFHIAYFISTSYVSSFLFSEPLSAHEVLQLKQECFSKLSDEKILELIKSNFDVSSQICSLLFIFL